MFTDLTIRAQALLSHARGVNPRWRQCFYALGLAAALFVGIPYFGPTTPATPATGGLALTDSSTLSEADATRYRLAFAAQSSGDYAGADSILAQVENPILMGHVLAERYLNPNYHATPTQLHAWLDRYGDHPGAARIAKLAASRGIQLGRASGRSEAALAGSGYIDHLGRSGMPDNWYEGLRHWKEAQYHDALPLFAAIGADESLSGWQRAAGYYWAFRAADKLGASREASRALNNAAQFPTTFYGLLAARQQGTLEITAQAPAVDASLRRDPHTIRAALLAQLDRSEAAEAELRLLYARVPLKQRAGIVTLASELSLPNLQVRLARLDILSPAQALFAAYPMPAFMAQAQHAVDPALLMAIARNESGFRSDVGSSAGAVGMMQMLPSTARAVERRTGMEVASSSLGGGVISRLSDPATSVRYGAEYLKLLAAEPAISGNLVRLLAGYNAGPGAVANWQMTGTQINDPLLYIESIPYAETRNYVMQVMAQYWVYQLLRGEQATSLAALDRGQWPKV